MDNRVQAVSLDSNNFWIMVPAAKDLEIDLDIDSRKGVRPKVYMAVVDS